MTEEQYKDMVIEHDKNIDTLAVSIESLAANVGATNSKLDDVISVITQQNVLVERINNLDNNVDDAFKRAWGRIEKLEDTTEGTGCTTAKTAIKDCEALSQSVTNLSVHIEKLSEDIDNVESRLGTYVSGATIKWALGIILFYAVTFGVYTVNNIHTCDTMIKAHIARDAEHDSSINTEFSNILRQLRKNEIKSNTSK